MNNEPQRAVRPEVTVVHIVSLPLSREVSGSPLMSCGVLAASLPSSCVGKWAEICT
jgi:hypothetical protein